MPNVKAPAIPKRTSGPIPGADLITDVRGTSLAGGLAKGLEAVKTGEEQRAADLKQKADEANLLRARKALLDWQRKNIFAPKSENPEAALNLENELATGVTQMFQKEHDDYADSLDETLTSEEQKAQWARIKLAESEQVGKSLNAHERKQFEAVSETRYRDQIDALVQKAWLSYTKERGYDPAVISSSLAEANAIIDRRAKAYGWPEEVTKAQKLAASTRAITGLVTAMKEDAPGEAVRLFKDNKDKLDFTQPGVREMEAGLVAVGYRYQAQALVAKMTREKLSPEQMMAKLSVMETEEQLKEPVEVIGLAKQMVENKATETKKVKEVQDDSIYQAGLVRISSDSKGLTKDTFYEYKVLAQRKSEKAYWLWQKLEAAQREKSADTASRALQVNVDKQYINAVKRGIYSMDPKVLDLGNHDNPVFQQSLVPRRDGVPRLPTEAAIEQGKMLLAQFEKNTDAKTRQHRHEVNQKAWSIAYTLPRLNNNELRKEWVSKVMVQWDLERSKKAAIPDTEWSDKLISKMTSVVVTDPGALFFKGEMGYDEAWSLGLLGDAQEVTSEDQDNPMFRPGYQPPNVGSPSVTKPGKVLVRKGSIKAWVKESEIDEWLRENPDWSRE